MIASYAGVLRIDIATESAIDVTPGVAHEQNSFIRSADGFLQDMRTPGNRDGAAYYAVDPDDNRRYARYETTDAGLNWVKVYYISDLNYGSSSYYQPNYDSGHFNRQFLDHNFVNRRQPGPNGYPRAYYIYQIGTSAKPLPFLLQPKFSMALHTSQLVVRKILLVQLYAVLVALHLLFQLVQVTRFRQVLFMNPRPLQVSTQLLALW